MTGDCQDLSAGFRYTVYPGLTTVASCFGPAAFLILPMVASERGWLTHVRGFECVSMLGMACYEEIALASMDEGFALGCQC